MGKKETNAKRYSLLYPSNFISTLSQSLEYAPTLDPQVKAFLNSRFITPDYADPTRNIFDINDSNVFDEKTKASWFKAMEVLALQNPQEVGAFLEKYFGKSNPKNYDSKGNVKGFRLSMPFNVPGTKEQKAIIKEALPSLIHLFTDKTYTFDNGGSINYLDMF